MFCLCRSACKTCKATQGARVLQVRCRIKGRISTLFFFPFSLSPSDRDVKRRSLRRIGNNYLSESRSRRAAAAAVCDISRSCTAVLLFVSPSNSNPQEEYPRFHPARRGWVGGCAGGRGVEDYCFPICCPEQTRPYQSKPAQLLFHMALMYWKAFHSRLPLAAAAEQVSVARIPQWRTIGLFC